MIVSKEHIERFSAKAQRVVYSGGGFNSSASEVETRYADKEWDGWEYLLRLNNKAGIGIEEISYRGIPLSRRTLLIRRFSTS